MEQPKRATCERGSGVQWGPKSNRKENDQIRVNSNVELGSTSVEVNVRNVGIEQVTRKRERGSVTVTKNNKS